MLRGFFCGHWLPPCTIFVSPSWWRILSALKHKKWPWSSPGFKKARPIDSLVSAKFICQAFADLEVDPPLWHKEDFFSFHFLFYSSSEIFLPKRNSQCLNKQFLRFKSNCALSKVCTSTSIRASTSQANKAKKLKVRLMRTDGLSFYSNCCD